MDENHPSGNPDVPLLEVRNLQKYYDDGYHAVRGVSFSIPSGMLVGLIGPNGCGKSTMMRCISRIYEPTSGSITVDGRDVLHLKPPEVAKLVASVPAELGSTFNMTVMDMVTIPPFFMMMHVSQ